MEQRKTIQEYLNMYNDDDSFESDIDHTEHYGSMFHDQLYSEKEMFIQQAYLERSQSLDQSELLDLIEQTQGRTYLQELHQEYE